MMMAERHLNRDNLNPLLDGRQNRYSLFCHLTPIQTVRHNRPQNNNPRPRHNAGFTMAELLTVVAILAVLAAIAGIAVANYLRDITLTEYDNAAKSIYIAAQNNIADLQASGEWTGDNGTYASPDNKTNAAPLNNEENKNYTFYAVNAAAARTNGILPPGTIDETVRSNDYVIEYCYETATVYGVFYSKESTGAVSAYYTEGKSSGSDGFRTLDSRRNHNPEIGYYGGADAANLSSVILKSPVVSAGRSSAFAIEDPNLAGVKDPDGTTTLAPRSTTTIITLSKSGLDNTNAESRVMLALSSDGISLQPTVRLINNNQIITLLDSSFCSYGDPTTKTIYSINLVSLQGNAQLSNYLSTFQAGDEFSITAKCVTGKALCRPAYGYGTGIWTTADDAVFTSNVIADYETSATIPLYYDQKDNANKTEPFSINLENYYNADTYSNETLYYKISATSGISNSTTLTAYKIATGKVQSIQPDANGYYQFDMPSNGEINTRKFTYHTLSGISVDNASSFNGGSITINIYKKKSASPATYTLAKTLTINVSVLSNEHQPHYYVEDHASYADVIVTAGNTSTDSITITTSAAVVSDQSNELVIYRYSDGRYITAYPLRPGASATFRFLKTSSDQALTTESFTVYNITASQ